MIGKTVSRFSIDDIAIFKQKMLSWANRFNIFCFLDNQDYTIAPHHLQWLLAIADEEVQENHMPFHELDDFIKKGWSFGHLSFDLGNEWFELQAGKENPIRFPRYHFFHPAILIGLDGDKVFIQADQPEAIFKGIRSEAITGKVKQPITLQPRLSKDAYLSTVAKLQEHIQRGDCYEINFCQEFYSSEVEINPINLFQDLIQASPNPFSVLYKWREQYLLCASPERFLSKSGDQLISQPIKGTSPRYSNDPEKDEASKQALLNSTKERSENVMIVDLVRNDLSMVCKEGSVKVDELFGIYSFPQVHQMISTITGEMKAGISFSQIMKATFPMGSMTGAPKKRVMELIHQYEVTGRGIFSGAVGYINENGDFDFNVVIRSLMYNASTQYLSCQVGSGITIYSDPEKEWDECQLKAAAIKKVLA
jgi:para-aminobenzoate synthetase component 1